ncbi:MAG: cytochrome o ubiquinol oxidase subunit III [Candidatus Tokpelaia sp. JSC085]|nr:MAG: cytochrome o ubiquinol oxidase subunit III [Candidatus Tokpelaia sp. JSC085]
MSEPIQVENHCIHDHDSTKIFGFWIYLLQDLFLFATLFANMAVFSASYDIGPSGRDFIDLTFVLVETVLLLVSSITYGFAMIQLHRNSLVGMQIWMTVTFFLGLTFIMMELYEFNHLIHAGAAPWVSAYWSSFFVLVATHGAHVTGGLLWMICMFVHLSWDGLNTNNRTRMTCLSLFWHFLDIVWIGVFTLVYLLGAL